MTPSPRQPIDDPDPYEPAIPPLEPDQGSIHPVIPDDPEHDRVVDPED